MISNNEIIYYTTEACAYFALALHELFGYEINMLIDDQEPEELQNFETRAEAENFMETYQPPLAHVFCVNSRGEVVDIKGKRSISSVKKDYYDLEEPRVIDISPEELKSDWMGNDKPLFPYSKQEVEDAKNIILENKELFIDSNEILAATIIFGQFAKFADPVLFKNYDYTDDDKNGPGIGLFNGPMDRFKSVDEFRKHKAARNRRKKKIKDLHNKVLR